MAGPRASHTARTGLTPLAAVAAAAVLTAVYPAFGFFEREGRAGTGTIRTFDGDAAGRVPPGFTFHVVRSTAVSRWLVEREGSNGFLAHGQDTDGRGGFALAVLDAQPRVATSVSARVRLTGGARSGGIVWRVQDADNYYLARLDIGGAEQDLGLYRVVQGNRVRIEGEDDLELDPNAWHTLKVVQESENIRVYLGGIRVLRARDRTFGASGGAGVWCTGDSVAHFDDLRLDSGAGHEDPHR